MKYDLLVIGGGAAGFYGAVHAARQCPGLRVAILEKGKAFLEKVRISGGGRCNLTHRPLDPRVLAGHYPRGHRELIGPFHNHASREVITFFEKLGMSVKTEADGRVFPVSDRSQDVIDTLTKEARRLNIELIPGCGVQAFGPDSPGTGWWVETAKGPFHSQWLLVTAGSSKKIWGQLRELGHTIVPPVPSLFTFRIPDPRLQGLQGLSCPATIAVLPPENGDPLAAANFRKAQRAGSLTAEGPTLITHWGLSGPAVLKLSAWAARLLAACGYHFRIQVNWVPEYHPGSLPQYLEEVRRASPARTVVASRPFDLAGRLWASLVAGAGIKRETTWQAMDKAAIRRLSSQLSEGIFRVEGKSTFKEEFVTAGGVALKEVDFKTFQSRKLPGLFLAGEILDVDAVTGGFNFQNAWTGAFMAARGIAAAAALSEGQKE
ncbi:aminoacetone oxidase family FAD-binding enzyme [Robiginitalea sp. M366]|uniref:aminoacetone oxidase family FAD-binding enzyme n=1 Tax=Robiginitalea aestuariiviva TaxID=3036903 RepID=UPI00240E7D55|nr:aminoacetone oxidase family FAD-binding enzyme [Robiginitalea aestuariiviva]MDG1571828.1 aminoacetone oxidase family FAD-binding enzyme [Robiginitalea aestuariiviva]